MNIYKNFRLSKQLQRGFTIVELLIVIVVIGILAALVVTTYNGIQQKARDTERKTDVNALHSHAEAFQAENGRYPTMANFNDTTFRSNNMKGLDAAALQDPKGTAQTLVAAPSTTAYAYTATPANCDNGAGGDCTGYTLTATLEAGGTYVKQSLN
jgi:type II secretion system protein G